MSASEKKSSDKKKEMQPINPADDAMMVREGLRNPLFIQDPEWSRKTSPEKAAAKRVAKIKGLRASAPGKTIRTVKHRLVVHLKNPNQVEKFKTTYSEQLYADQVLGYLLTTFDKLKGEILIVYYNGKVFPYSN